MSDFVFSKQRRPAGFLAVTLQGIYHDDTPETSEFHGAWGSLAVTRSLYNGFAPIETDDTLCVIIGGPVLTFADNQFLAGGDPTRGTRLVMDRWRSSEGIKWEEDLSGPFVALRLDKVQRKIEVVTDLLSFIPLFQSDGQEGTVLGTHVDVVAKVAKCDKIRDPVSIADFILRGVVTYPYTFYPGVKQASPASVNQWALNDYAYQFQSRPYWQPFEENPYGSLIEAADALREGLQAYVNSVADGMDRVATFLTGGEDTRVLLGMIPERCERDAFIFLDSMNREGRIAQSCAAAYGANFKMFRRDGMHYLDILPKSADLTGTGTEYVHLHTYGFHKSAGLKHHKAVFGGYLSDTLLKAHHVRRVRVSRRLPFSPYIKTRDQTRPSFEHCEFLSTVVLEELNKRIDTHEQLVRTFRSDDSAQEWSNIWPVSMHKTIPNLHGNRRLFPSYEPYMAGCAVRIAAAVPQFWKLNRRLFHRMAKPILKPTRHLLHAEGFFPYHPWYINNFARYGTWIRHQMNRSLDRTKADYGPWTNWRAISESPEWKDAIDSRVESAVLPDGLFTVSLRALFEGQLLNWPRQRNLMQVLYQMSDHEAQKSPATRESENSLS